MISSQPRKHFKKPHPKDKRDQMESSGVVYRVGFNNCNQAYKGETGRNMGFRMEVHMTNVFMVCDSKRYTRSERKTSERVWNQSAIMDY